MKISFFLLLAAMAIASNNAFAPQQTKMKRTTRTTTPTTTTTTIVCHESHKPHVDEISHELQELGNEIKPQLRSAPHGMDEYHESLLHHFRKELHLRDIVVKDMQQSLDRIEQELKALGVVWETAEVELLQETRQHMRENSEHEKELNSIRFLLGRAVKLTARRTVNVVLAPFRFVLRKAVGGDEKHVEDLEERLI